VLVQGEAGASFKDNQFVATGARCFQGHRCAGYPDRDGIRPHACAARILRHAQEDRAAAQFDIAPSIIETKNRICAQARDGQVEESEFRPRIIAGAHTGALAHLIVYGRGSRRRFGREKVNVSNDPGDTRFVFRGIGRCAHTSGDKQNRRCHATRQNFMRGIHRPEFLLLEFLFCTDFVLRCRYIYFDGRARRPRRH
jgi:hypothetical protein